MKRAHVGESEAVGDGFGGEIVSEKLDRHIAASVIQHTTERRSFTDEMSLQRASAQPEAVCDSV